MRKLLFLTFVFIFTAFPPVISGYSSDATLEYGMPAQSSGGIFKGEILSGFYRNTDLPVILCQTYGLSDSIEQIRKLPLIITKAEFQNNDTPIGLIISGDGGWYGFEQSLADNLAKIGIPTIGLDSRKYFWNRVSPEKTAGDIAMALNYYSKEWGKRRFLMIGYSLGAEIVPFIVTRFSEEMRSKISATVLLSPETNTDFEIHFSNMLGMGNSRNSYKVIDEILKMQEVPVLIIFGQDEKTQVPELLNETAVITVKIPGDHHYKFNTHLIIQTMKDNKAF